MDAMPSSRSRSRSPLVSHTASTLSRLHPPTNTDNRRKSFRSAALSRSYPQSMAARSVCCRCGRSREPPVNSCNRLARRVNMEDGERTLTRAAASSIARGRPSNRAQISATAEAFSRLSSKSGLAAAARCTNSVTAGHCDSTSTEGMDRESGSVSGGSGNSCSPYRCNAARLVTRILRLGPAAKIPATVGTA